MSGVDPGPKGTTIRTVLVGQFCAGSDVAVPSSSKNAVYDAGYCTHPGIRSTRGQLALMAAILYCGSDPTRV